jgi:hypothetical protein
MLTSVPMEASDDARWADAVSLLERTPTDSATQRLRHSRRMQVLLVVSVMLASAAVMVLVVVFFRGSLEARTEHVPTWQVVVGFIGQWIAQPTGYRASLAVGYVLLLCAALCAFFSCSAPLATGAKQEKRAQSRARNRLRGSVHRAPRRRPVRSGWMPTTGLVSVRSAT